MGTRCSIENGSATPSCNTCIYKSEEEGRVFGYSKTGILLLNVHLLSYRVSQLSHVKPVVSMICQHKMDRLKTYWSHSSLCWQNTAHLAHWQPVSWLTKPHYPFKRMMKLRRSFWISHQTKTLPRQPWYDRHNISALRWQLWGRHFLKT